MVGIDWRGGWIDDLEWFETRLEVLRDQSIEVLKVSELWRMTDTISLRGDRLGSSWSFVGYK